MVTSLYGPEEARPEIWVVLEAGAGCLADISLELLAKGRLLADQAGWRLSGLLFGDSAAPLAPEAWAHGADEVILATHPLLEAFSVGGYAQGARQTLQARQPAAVLFGATPRGRDLAGRLAVRLRTGLNADCTELTLHPESGSLVCEVSGFGGGVLAMIEMPHHRPQLATVRPGVFRPGQPQADRQGTLTRLPVTLSADDILTRVVEATPGTAPDLTKAEVLVVGGRGIGPHFDLLERLAEILNGQVGGTRPPVDEGHLPRERQIGQTGVVCRPKIALVGGASGAFHFVVGIQEAGVVIAINNDPQAPIFEHADYCIVGDVLEILPALIATLSRQPQKVGAP